MLESEICVNCVCLPICKHKNYTKTAQDCAYIRNIFVEAALTIMFGDDIDVHFLGIEKTYFVNHDSCNISIGIAVDEDKISQQKYYLFTYPHEHLVDVDFNLKSSFPHM